MLLRFAPSHLRRSYAHPLLSHQFNNIGIKKVSLEYRICNCLGHMYVAQIYILKGLQKFYTEQKNDLK